MSIAVCTSVIAAGAATRATRATRAIDNTLARTPPMGWNSWNKFGCNVSDKLIREVADAMSANGMRDAGYRYVTIDDCWQVARGANGVIVADSTRFPHGIKALADYVHARGLGFGIYTDAGRTTCEGRPGSYGYEAIDARTYASWGVDYVKIDWCNTEGLDARTRYTIFRDALAASGRAIVFSICEWGRNEPWTWAPAVGNGGMTQTEYRAHFSLWAMMAAPLIAGNDVRTMMDTTRAAAGVREILLNAEVIAVDQDSLGVQGKIVQSSPSELQVWVKPLTDGSRAVLLFNRASVPTTITAEWTRVGIKTKSARVRDLWTHVETPAVEQRYSATVPSHGVVMLRVWPVA